MGHTELRAQAAVYLETLELYLYTADHFSMSRTDLRAQAAVPVYRGSISRLLPPPPPRR